MSEPKQKKNLEKKPKTPMGKSISRRSFFKYAGVSAAALTTVGLVGCDNNDNPIKPPPGSKKVTLGAGNIGILNFAYALEQLEAAFYATVVANMYSGASAGETALFKDIAGHELAHKKFFQTALGSHAIPALTPTFDAIDFSSKSSVVGTAQVFENLGVKAYNSQGAYIDTSAPNGLTYLLEAGKIVSVEARHATAVLNLDVSGNTGAFQNSPTVNDKGLEKTVPGSAAVLQAVSPYIKETVVGSKLPDQQ